jgi:hypothetical protein
MTDIAPTPGMSGTRKVPGWVKYLLIVIGAMFFCCCTIPAAALVRNVMEVLDGTRAAQEQADRFWTAIADMQLETAYGMLDTETQAVVSQRDFVSALVNTSITKRDLYIPDQAGVEAAEKGETSGRVVLVRGTIVDENDEQLGTTAAWFRFDGKDWMLLCFHLDR